MPAPTLAPAQQRDTITPTRAARMVRALRAAGRPAYLWGQPGIGKSESMRDLADSLFAAMHNLTVLAGGRLKDNATGRETTLRPYFKDVRASTLDPVDLRGLPRVAPDGKHAEFLPFDFLPLDGEGIICLDEVNRAPLSVQNALLELCLDRRIGSYRLPDGWYVVACGNYQSDGGGVQKLTAALAARFVHLYVEPDFQSWRKWALDNGIHPLVIAYLTNRDQNPYNPDGSPRPNVFCAFDKTAQDGPPGPNPRAWKFVSDVLDAQPDKDDLLVLVQGATGRPVAMEFVPYVRMQVQLPNLENIIRNPTSASVPTEISAQYAVATALAARADARTFPNIVTYLERMPQEFAAYAIKDATARDESLCNLPEYTAWAIHNGNGRN